MKPPYNGEPLKVGDRIRFLRTVIKPYAIKDMVYLVVHADDFMTALDSDFYLYGEGAVVQLREGTTWERA